MANLRLSFHIMLAVCDFIKQSDKLIYVIENPYIAAQRFLEKNLLPLTYLDETVKFIESNTSGVELGQGSSEFVDPYTGKCSPF